MRTFDINKSKKTWPCGVSDGLNLPCAICGKKKIQFDYSVEDEVWDSIVPKNIRRDVICLPCLDRMARKKGVDIASKIEFIQFTGIGATVELVPANVFYYKVKRKRKKLKDFINSIMRKCPCDKTIIIYLPDDIATHREIRNVSIDKCIAHVIKYLWKKKVDTLGCCCGHGKECPILIINSNYREDGIKDIKRLIKKVNNQDWNILQWKLTKV